MIGLIGKKIGMTQVFDEVSNHQIPVTVVEVGPCPVTQIKTKDNDGYSAVQIGYGETKEARLSKPRIEYHSGLLCVEVSWLIEIGLMTKSNYKILVHRKKMKLARRGCKNTPALVEYESNSATAFFESRDEAIKVVDALVDEKVKDGTDERIAMMHTLAVPVYFHKK